VKAPASSFPARWRRAFTRTDHGRTVDGLTPTAIAVGLVLSEYADWATGSGIRPTRKRVAGTVGVSVAAVGRAVADLITAGWLATEERGSFGRPSTHRLTIPSLVILATGEVSAPVTGSPVRHLPTRNRLTSAPLSAPGATRNRLTGAHVTGSLVRHHLCQDLRPWLASVGAA
jgi:hypothetical protein